MKKKTKWFLGISAVLSMGLLVIVSNVVTSLRNLGHSLNNHALRDVTIEYMQYERKINGEWPKGLNHLGTFINIHYKENNESSYEVYSGSFVRSAMRARINNYRSLTVIHATDDTIEYSVNFELGRYKLKLNKDKILESQYIPN